MVGKRLLCNLLPERMSPRPPPGQSTCLEGVPGEQTEFFTILSKRWCGVKRTFIRMQSRQEHHTVSGNTFVIDRRLERCGRAILLERTYVSHPDIAGIRSILLPDQHLWVIFFEAHRPPHPMNCYMHMARILDEGDTVTVEDLYLDVILRQNGQWQLVDVDEFRQAIARGELSGEQVQAALGGLEQACLLVQTHGAAIEAHLREYLICNA